MIALGIGSATFRLVVQCTATGGNKIMFEISTSWSTLAASSSKPILRFILVFSNMESQFPSHIQPEMLEARSLSDAVSQYAAKPCGSNHIPNSITCIRFQVLKVVSLLQCDCVRSGRLTFRVSEEGANRLFRNLLPCLPGQRIRILKTNVLSDKGLQNLPLWQILYYTTNCVASLQI